MALTADLEKVFLMVSVEEADRDVLWFLWVKDFKKEPPDFIIYRFTRVVFGVSSSPFLLNATIWFHMERYLKTNEDLVHRLLCSTYVDDIITSGETEEEAIQLYVRSKQIFREGEFNLRKFLTNSKHLQQQIDLKESQHTSQFTSCPLDATSGMSHPLGHKVLGIPWNPTSDQLLFNTSDLTQLSFDLRPMKRNIVSLIGKFYDTCHHTL